MTESEDLGGGGLASRRLAWEILQRVEEGAFADALLGHRLSRSNLSQRDQALVTRLVYSTLSWQLYLDHLLAPFCRRSLQKLDRPVHLLLRLAMVQLSVLTKIPTFAVVDTTVELAKGHRRGAAAGFVNAVLRQAASKWRSVALPSEESDPALHLSVRWSHPLWLVEQWLGEYGRSRTEALLAANNENAPTALRINALRADRDTVAAKLRAAGFESQPSAYAPAALRLETSTVPERMPGFTEGLYSFQGEASQLVGLMVAPRPGDRVLDLCAAPGGKTLHMAELMKNRGEIVSRDVNARGVAAIRSQAARLGITIVKAEIADAVGWSTAAGGTVEQFDRVLVDAPCSGLGTLRSHPELKWRRKPSDSQSLAELQRRILDAAAPQVKTGGLLTYSTCTVERIENEDVIASFLKRNREFVVDDPRPDLPDATLALVGADYCLRTSPDEHQLDGFFATRLLRR